MATRGKKPKTASNSAPPIGIKFEGVLPTSILNKEASKEFSRLCTVLFLRGTLERVDIAVLTECARITARLDQAYKLDELKVINQLTTQRRGLLRELGLTLQPSRSVVKTVAKETNQADPVAGKIKLHG